MVTKAKIPIIVDTREQRPYRLEGYDDVTITTGTIPTGDYSIVGFEDRVAVERKSLPDLVGCLIGEQRKRFERELARARHLEFFAVVVEANLADVLAGRYVSKMVPAAVLQSVIAFMVRYGHSFILAQDRAGGELVTHGLLTKWAREITTRAKALEKACKNIQS